MNHGFSETTVECIPARETRAAWAALTKAHRYLAELKGLCKSLPHQRILLDTLIIHEARFPKISILRCCLMSLHQLTNHSEEILVISPNK